MSDQNWQPPVAGSDPIATASLMMQMDDKTSSRKPATRFGRINLSLLDAVLVIGIIFIILALGAGLSLIF